MGEEVLKVVEWFGSGRGGLSVCLWEMMGGKERVWDGMG